MGQYKSFIQIIIIIRIIRIIIRKKTKIKKNKRQMVGTDGRGESVQRERVLFLYFLLISFSYLWKSDCRFLSEQKAKLVHATRATHRYQYLSILSNFKR